MASEKVKVSVWMPSERRDELRQVAADLEISVNELINLTLFAPGKLAALREMMRQVKAGALIV